MTSTATTGCSTGARSSRVRARVPTETVEKVLRLYREQYFDFNIRHFVEKLHQEHRIDLSYTWVKTALQMAGLVAKRRKRGTHRKKRPRRPLPGMLLHIDASTHRWVEPWGTQDLIVVADDATSEMYYAQLVEEESTATVMAALKAVIEQHGLFCSLYSDRASHFVYTPVAGGVPDRSRRTQVERALAELGIELIAAHSPQARGRSERLFGTLQGRLPQELRLRGISAVEEANVFLREHWIAAHNKKFAVAATQSGTAFVPVAGQDLSKIFSHQQERVVGNDNTVRFQNLSLQVPQQTFRFSLAKCRVLVCQRLNQSITVHYGPHTLGVYSSDGALQQAESKQRKRAAG